jgi:indolepyruvate ferredoxin oxidoreductase beta subunit
LEQIKDLSAKTCIVHATDEAQKMGNHMLANMILIGALLKTGLVPLDEAAIGPVISEMFPKAVEDNTRALKAGMELASILQ